MKYSTIIYSGASYIATKAIEYKEKRKHEDDENETTRRIKKQRQ